MKSDHQLVTPSRPYAVLYIYSNIVFVDTPRSFAEPMDFGLLATNPRNPDWDAPLGELVGNCGGVCSRPGLCFL
jgi:hypothetical protein